MRIKKGINSNPFGSPARYPQTATSEITATAKLKYLLDKQSVKADIKELDKVPNIDGTFELTNNSQIPYGKLEVQVKSIVVKRQPKYQCSIEFLAYCHDSVLPVLLIGVDSGSNVAYWIHLNRTILYKLEKKRKAGKESVSLDLPLGNRIELGSNSYIAEWKNIVDQYKEYAAYPEEKKKAQQLQKKVDKLTKLIRPALKYTSEEIAEMNIFLDHYNYILAREFKFAKDMLYFNFWKIGMAINKYTDIQTELILYPIKYSQNEPLLKQVKGAPFDILERMFLEEDAIMLTTPPRSSISQTPIRSSYKLLKSSVLKAVKNINLPLPSLSLANEYLSSFVTKFHAVLGLDFTLGNFSLYEIQHKIKNLLPLIVYHSKSIIEREIEVRANIDLLLNMDTIRLNKRLLDAKNIFEEGGLTSQVNLILTSREFDIQLIYFYLDYLIEAGETQVSQSILHEQYEGYNVHVWKNWKKDVVLQNLENFFSNFLDIYNLFITTYCNIPAKYSEFIPPYQICICLLSFKEGTNKKPRIEFYFLEGPCDTDHRFYFYESTDESCPINNQDFSTIISQVVKVNNQTYSIRCLKTHPLDFLFTNSPTYTLLRELLEEKLKHFFDDMNLLDQ